MFFTASDNTSRSAVGVCLVWSTLRFDHARIFRACNHVLGLSNVSSSKQKCVQLQGVQWNDALDFTTSSARCTMSSIKMLDILQIGIHVSARIQVLQNVQICCTHCLMVGCWFCPVLLSCKYNEMYSSNIYELLILFVARVLSVSTLNRCYNQTTLQIHCIF